MSCLEINDDFIKRLKEEEALLRVKAENLGIMIDFPEEEKIEEKAQETEEKVPPEEEEAQVEEERFTEEREHAEEQKDRFALFLEDVKKQRKQLEGEKEEGEEIDILAETEDMLQLYTKDYIAKNLGEAKKQYEVLSQMPVPDTDSITQKKIRKNVGDFASRIREAEEFMEAITERRCHRLSQRSRDLQMYMRRIMI